MKIVYLKMMVWLFATMMCHGADTDGPGSRSLKLPTFSGKQKDFQIWWLQFSAYASVCGFAAAIKTTKEADLPDQEEEDANDTAKQKEARKRNSLAVCNFTLAFGTASCMSFVLGSTTAAFPSGLAYLIVKALFNAFKPQDTISRVEMRNELLALTLGAQDNPSTLFEQISSIKHRFPSVDDADLIASAIAALPDAYHSSMTSLQMREGDSLTLDQVEQTAKTYYRVATSTRNSSTSTAADREIAMNAVALGNNQNNQNNGFVRGNRGGGRGFGNRTFGGRGNGRGNGGRPYDGQGGINRRSPRHTTGCYICGGRHGFQNCWELECNADRRPHNWVSVFARDNTNQDTPAAPAEIANIAVDNMGEILMCTVTVSPQLFPTDAALLQDPHIYVLDSAATQHVSKSTTGMNNLYPADKSFHSITANGTVAYADMVGKLHAIVCNNQGVQLHNIQIQEVVYSPSAPFNLISEGYYAKQGFKIEGDATYKRLYHSDGRELMFDIVINTPRGMLWAICLKPNASREVTLAMTDNASKQPPSVNIQQAHRMFGHMGEDLTRKTATHHGYTITRGTLKACEPCAISKARRKNLPTGANLPAKATKDRDRAYIDQASLRRKDSFNRNILCYVWCLIKLEYTGLFISYMFRKKNQMSEFLCHVFHRMKERGNMPKIVRMDNAGENLKFKERAESKDWKLNLVYELTAPNTPQQNAPVEVGIPTLLNRANALCVDANIPADVKHLLLPRAILTVTKLDGLQPVRLEGVVKSKYEHQYGSNPAFAKYPLRIFGEALTVTIYETLRGKQKARGITCLFTGYPVDHAGDHYEIWNPKTQKFFTSRDITPLRRMYYASTGKPAIEDPVLPEPQPQYIEIEDLAPPVAPDVPPAVAVAPQVDPAVAAAPPDDPVAAPDAPPDVPPVPDAEPLQVHVPDLQDVVDQVQNPVSPVQQLMARGSQDAEEDFSEAATQPISNARPRRQRTQVKRMFAASDGNFHDAYINSSIDCGSFEITLTPAEEKFYAAMDKYGLDGTYSALEFASPSINIGVPFSSIFEEPDPQPTLLSFHVHNLDVHEAYLQSEPTDPAGPLWQPEFSSMLASRQPYGPGSVGSIIARANANGNTINGMSDASFAPSSTSHNESIVDFLPHEIYSSDDESSSSSSTSTSETSSITTWDSHDSQSLPSLVSRDTSSVGSSLPDLIDPNFPVDACSVESSNSSVVSALLDTETEVTQGWQNAHFSTETPIHSDTISLEKPTEFVCVGAGLGGGFTDTTELHVMTYNQAMSKPDKAEWEKSVDKEHTRMVTNNVFTPVDIQDVPPHATVLSTKWAMKKKANGTYRARMVARGFEQIDGEHYDEHDKSSPVVSEITIRIVLVLMLMTGFWAEVVDVCGAFLLGKFEAGHKMFINVPQGFEKFYPSNVVLFLTRTLYGLKQSAIQYWKLCTQTFKTMGYTRSKADACLQFMWTAAGLLIWITWVDDCLCVGPKTEVLKAKAHLSEFFDTDEGGPLKEYIGMKVDIDRATGSLKLTQPVMIQSFMDEFDLPGEIPPNPAPQGEILKKGEDETDNLTTKFQKLYRKGVGKLLHMSRWTRPDCLNRVRELSRFMQGATKHHLKRMYRVMDFVVATAQFGWYMQPNAKWDGKDREFEFDIRGKADSDYGVDPATRRSISGGSTFLCGACVCARSRMQSCVTLSVTEAEFVAAVDTAQDMLFTMRVLESMGLKVKKPMILQIDNKGAVDLANNWSSAGRTRHVAVRICFLRELKEQGLILTEWISNEHMSSDIFTKNVGGEDFDRHSGVYIHDQTFPVTSKGGCWIALFLTCACAMKTPMKPTEMCCALQKCTVISM